jgi:transglutaminase-like putative cysteine protease
VTAADLAATPQIESDHPRILALAAELGAEAGSAREHAVRLHDFVRDEIRFGWTRGFYRLSATEVLDARVG